MKKIFVILFVFLLIGFSVLNIFAPKREFSETENRYLKKAPEFDLQSFFMGDYTEKFEEYLTDSVFFRDGFVLLKSNVEKIWGKYENNNIYFAKDGYLIDKAPQYDEEILKNNTQAINIMAESGKYNVSVSLIPTAYEILKEKLPPYAYTGIQPEILSFVKDNLKNVTFIDSLKTLSDLKDDYLYYRTDHHQTMHGSFAVYGDIIKSLGDTPYSKNDFNIETVSDKFFGTTWSKTPVNVPADSIIKYSPLFDVKYQVEYVDKGEESDSLYVDKNLQIKDKYTYYLGGNNSVLNIKTNLKNGKKLAIFKDSYAHSIIPMLANHYEEISVIDLRYYNLNPEKILQEKGIEDVLFIYNVTNFMTDKNLSKITAYMSHK